MPRLNKFMTVSVTESMVAIYLTDKVLRLQVLKWAMKSEKKQSEIPTAEVIWSHKKLLSVVHH